MLLSYIVLGVVMTGASGLGACTLDNPTRLNVFMALATENVQEWHLATLESVFYIYPNANVVIAPNRSAKDYLERFVAPLASRGYCLSISQTVRETFLELQLLVLQWQYEFGGLYVPFDGALLNTIDYFLHPPSGGINEAVFQEILQYGSNGGFGEQDVADYKWERPHNDLHPNVTFPCAVHCLRYVPKAWLGLPLLVEGIRKGGHPDAVLVGVIRALGLESVVMLPFWLITESKFPDHWRAFGSKRGFTDSSTDLFAPRNKRHRYDYWLVVSNKLWLPWFLALPEDTNVVDLSVVALVRQQMSLDLFSVPFRPFLDKQQPEWPVVQLKSPYDQIRRLLTPEQLRQERFPQGEIGLPGDRGGYRTFRHLRVASQLESVRVRVSLLGESGGSVALYCRSGPLQGECETSVARDQKSMSTCGAPAFVNSVIDQLAYSVTVRERDFVTIRVELANSCDSEEFLPSTEFLGLAVNVTDTVSVIAHSANRCESLSRLIRSLHTVYPGTRVLVSCERAHSDLNHGDPVTEPGHGSHVDWFSVPYDFGLSRGKSFLASRVLTEFTLVLDDDFVFTYSSCLECLVWRLRSKTHSALVPLDLVGFPILEDERAFGAFRGSLTVSNSRLAVEPFVQSTTADGCMRVDICPMVFLARSERLKSFRWNADLPVGEHELFFASNRPAIAVCGDVSFTHFRVPPGKLPEDYRARRERQRELMSEALSSVGIGQTFYFFAKYSHQDGSDFDSLLSKGVNPYSVRDDSGDSVDVTVGPFRFCYVAVLSQQADLRAQYRLSHMKASGVCEVLFFVPASQRGDEAVGNELAENRDIVWTPTGATRTGFIFETMRRFLFHYVVFVEEGTNFNQEAFRDTLGGSAKHMHVLQGQGIRGISRDFHHLLSHPMNIRHFESSGDVLRDIDTWTMPFKHTTQEFETVFMAK